MKEIDNMITRESVINLTYWQEYQDPEDHDFFKIHHTIFRNVPLSQLKRLNSESFKMIPTKIIISNIFKIPSEFKSPVI